MCYSFTFLNLCFRWFASQICNVKFSTLNLIAEVFEHWLNVTQLGYFTTNNQNKIYNYAYLYCNYVYD